MFFEFLSDYKSLIEKKKMIEAEDSAVNFTKRGGYTEINGCTQSMPAWQIVGISIVVGI